MDNLSDIEGALASASNINKIIAEEVRAKRELGTEALEYFDRTLDDILSDLDNFRKNQAKLISSVTSADAKLIAFKGNNLKRQIKDEQFKEETERMLEEFLDQYMLEYAEDRIIWDSILRQELEKLIGYLKGSITWLETRKSEITALQQEKANLMPQSPLEKLKQEPKVSVKGGEPK